MPEKFIANIEEIAEKQLKELGLKPRFPLRIFKEKKKKFYTTPCQTQDRKTVLFKMLISDSQRDGYSLKKEIEVNQWLSAISEKIEKFNGLLFGESNTKRPPYWYCRQYLKGPLLGHHFKIYKTGLKAENRKKLVNQLLVFQSLMSLKDKPPALNVCLEKKEEKSYLKIIKQLKRNLKLKKAEKQISFPEVYRFFEKNKGCFKKNFTISHGDFTLANFFVNRGNVYVTDFEHSRLDNFAADIARLWIQTYQYPKWRKKLILEFLAKQPKNKKNDFKQSFRLIAIAEAITEFKCDFDKTSRETALKKAVRKTIEAAFQGFNNLMSL